MASSCPWKAKVLRSLSANKSLAYSRYVQLATVKPDGTPANRTVVFRGFLEDGDDLTFVTDRRSQKVEEIAANPRGEVCWYFPNSREQYRLSGTLAVVAEGDGAAPERLLAARQAAWARMSELGRAQFTWPHPGLPRLPEKEEDFLVPAPGGDEPAAPAFCLVVMRVHEVDHLRLRSNQRTLYRLPRGPSSPWEGPSCSQPDSAWTEEDVNP